MKLINTTDFPDVFVRKMLTWLCRELELPRSAIREARFTNSSSVFRGRSFCRSGRILCRVGPVRLYPYPDLRDRDDIVFQDQLEGLVYIAAHELFHLYQYRHGRLKKYQRREKAARGAGYRCMFAFRTRRETLLAYWMKVRTR